MLSASDYRSILGVLRDCAQAEDTEEFRAAVLDSVTERLGYEHLTFFLGQHPTLELELRDPVTVGLAEPLIDSYLARFARDDVFATEQARTVLHLHGTACLPQLLQAAIAPPQDAYIENFLVPNGITDKVMVWLDTELPVHGFLGVIGVGDAVLDPRDAEILAELRPHLAAQLRRHLRLAAAHVDASPLTIREHQVARLVADGWTNRAISKHLDIGESTVKKHITRVLAKLGVQSRTELAAMWRPVMAHHTAAGSESPAAG
ncbi:LuxR family transcriptional regulator [Rhodococcus sp. ABRD24]|uniref:helix-turn-helix transcriptional regulator n=1 Tax=Rhodococcus sp. ABRD24 TaxID=2507582 RepID=UPI00103C67CE|nr:helix-turn-helix transcriptional regulator [Rhodococcus sp. ABRD24]QBJ95343.1 LuxR family transcriptional regulator [Rhodococcus sp. ABRD24]